MSCGTADEIAENATKLITFIDLAGHQKYLRTTISGLTGYAPHYAMLVVSASAGVVPMTQEHLGIAVALQVSKTLFYGFSRTNKIFIPGAIFCRPHQSGRDAS